MSVSYYRDYLAQLIPSLRYAENEPLSKYTSFKIGGKTPLIIFPETSQDIAGAVRAAAITGTKVKILGGGSNILVGDQGIDCPVIRINGGSMNFAEEDVIDVDAGCSKAALAVFAAENGLSGAEFMRGIPGTVGGGVFMNAGAYGGEMSQVIESVTACDGSGVTRVFTCEECELAYRHSFFMDNPEYIILRARIRLKKGDKTEINEKMAELAAKRREKQPLEYPSAGSTFKRPEGYFAGKLIEDSGLKGYAVGGAQVSEKHAGFVINRGGATSEDVLKVIEHVKETVLRNFGVELQQEVELW